MPSSAGPAGRRDAHAFPTRRSSDLTRHRLMTLAARSRAWVAAATWPAVGATSAFCMAMAAATRAALAASSVGAPAAAPRRKRAGTRDRKSTRLNSSHPSTSYAVICGTCRPQGRTRFPYTTLFRSYAPPAHDAGRALPRLGRGRHLAGRRRHVGVLHGHGRGDEGRARRVERGRAGGGPAAEAGRNARSEEHTSELQSPVHLVCRHLRDLPAAGTHTLSLHDALPILRATGS